jgi:hypothetical protein
MNVIAERANSFDIIFIPPLGDSFQLTARLRNTVFFAVLPEAACYALSFGPFK